MLAQGGSEWHWPMRGIRIGEATNPGPPHAPRAFPVPVVAAAPRGEELDLDPSQIDDSASAPIVPNAASSGDYIGPNTRLIRAALIALDPLNLQTIFTRRVTLLKSVPFPMKGGIRMAFRLALEIIDKGYEQRDVAKQERGWKLFFLVPRLLLYKRPGELLIPKEELSRRCAAFAKGQWQELLAESDKCLSLGQNRKQTAEEGRLIRAETLIGLGELSPARQALESSELAK